MPQRPKDAPPFRTIWKLGCDLRSRRELLALWSRRYRLPAHRWLKKLVPDGKPHIELCLAGTGGAAETRIVLRRKDGGDHASFFENFFEIPYRLADLGPVGLAVDAGAHAGCFSLLLHRFFPEAEIIAFEPSEANVEALEKNLRRNTIRGRVVRKALWTDETELEFVAGKSNSGRIAATSAGKERKARETTIRIPATSLQAELGERLAELDLLKLDIEGAELEVLEALLPDLPERTRILCELHFTDDNRARFEAILAKHGWTGEVVDEDHPPHSNWIIRRNPHPQ